MDTKLSGLITNGKHTRTKSIKKMHEILSFRIVVTKKILFLKKTTFLLYNSFTNDTTMITTLRIHDV